jgi:phenylacetate-CoA ligase
MRESVNGHSDREKAKAALQHSIREAIGVSVTVSVLDPGEVERSVGKAKRVVDMRPPT